MPPARYANAPIALISLNYNLNYERAGLGGRNFIGYPKQPTITVYYLVDGEYDLHQFRSCEMIESPTFPDLKLSIDRMG